MNLLDDLQFQFCGTFAPTQATHVFGYLGTHVLFTPKDLQIMESPDERLNNVCINGIATVFSASPFTSQHAKQCTIFTTFNLLMV